MNVLFDVNARPVIAHRGGRARAPENTLEAMRGNQRQFSRENGPG